MLKKVFLYTSLFVATLLYFVDFATLKNPINWKFVINNEDVCVNVCGVL